MRHYNSNFSNLMEDSTPIITLERKFVVLRTLKALFVETTVYNLWDHVTFDSSMSLVN